MESLETPTKRFQCRRCSRAFARLEHLQRHERSHTKEKPFRCRECPKAFTRKDLLARHFRLTKHSPSTTEFDHQGSEHPATSEPLDTYKAHSWAKRSSLSSSGTRPGKRIAVSQAQPISNNEDEYQLSDQIASQITPAHLTDVAGLQNFDVAQSGQAMDLVPELSFNFGLDNLGSDTGQDLGEDFAAFMDSLPPVDHPFNPAYQPLPVFFPDVGATSDYPQGTRGATVRAVAHQRPQQASGRTVFPSSATVSLETSLSRYGSRLPFLEPDNETSTTSPHPQGPSWATGRQFFISADHRQQILQDLTKFSSCVDDDFVLPSRHTLSRFICSYFKNFHDHYPMFHLPTIDFEKMNVDLVLAIAALGARYAREPEIGVALYFVARAIVLERIRKHRSSLETAARSRQRDTDPVFSHDARPQSISLQSPESDAINNEIKSLLEVKQTLMILIAIATWYKHEPSATDAISIRSVLHSLIRGEDLRNTEESDSSNWKKWIEGEMIKRTQLVIFCLFNIHTICFDLPPMMLSTELQLLLPDSESKWKLEDENQWFEAQRKMQPPRQSFQGAYGNLFSSHGVSPAVGASALGGCALIHAVIQQIWLVRNARLPNQIVQGSLPAESMNSFEQALKQWTRSWEGNTESSMNPLNPHGPLTFTSTALLRLAYIRLHMDLGPVRSLSSWEPHTVAKSLHLSPGVRRSDKVTRAALHCAHALSIPVKLGITYVAQTQLIYWSNQHALCTLECAVLSAKWLEAVTHPQLSPPLTVAEQQVLEFMVQLIAETEYRIKPAQIIEQKARLSSMTVRLWAKLYQAPSVWQMVTLIGQALHIYADLLDCKQT